jgi:small-conductance mechanosensitive channel
MLAAAAVVLLSILVGFLARWQLLTRLARLAERTPWAADSAVIASMRWPLPLWCLLGGLHAASRLVTLPPLVARGLHKVLVVVLVGSISVWAASLLARLLELHGERHGDLRAASRTGVVRTLARVLVWTIGALVLLSTFGISVKPLLTTMGLGGLAVAFGLRETLANLFAGMNFMLARNLNVGDFVKLSSGEEGTVEDIQWRVTLVRTLFDTTVVVPNAKLADSVVTNYHQPSSAVTVVVPVGVHSASDLEQVERVTRAVARGIMETVPGGVPEFEPLVRFRGFGDSTVELLAVLRVRAYPASLLVKHEFIKALVRAYAEEGIVVPFPVRAINLEQESAAAIVAALMARATSESEHGFDEH